MGSAAYPALNSSAQGVVLGAVSDRPPGNRISCIRVFRQIPMLIDKPYRQGPSFKVAGLREMFSKGGQLPGLVRRGDIRIVRRIQVFINRQRIGQL